jgi:zinc-ribbon domain
MNASPKYCRECGTAIDAAAEFCPGCGTPVNPPAQRETVVQASPANRSGRPATPSLEARREILQAELRRYTRKGYRVVAQTDTTAQLVKPKTFSCLIAGVLLVFTFGTFLVLYLIWYLARKDKQVYLEIDEGGQVLRNGRR